MKERLYAGLAEALEIEVDEIKDEDQFRDYDHYDSLTELSILALLDEEFGVELEMPAYNSCQTVRDLLLLIANKNS